MAANGTIRAPARAPHRSIVALLALFVVGGCAVAGGGDLGTVAPPPTGGASLDVPSPEATPGSSEPAMPGPSSAAVTTVRAYFLIPNQTGGSGLAPFLRTIPRTLAVGRAAIEALIAGPVGGELGAPARATSDVPPGTRLLGLSIADAVADVDLSSEFAAGGASSDLAQRYGQVVYTLTQFPTVQKVRFELDGQSAPAVLPGGETTTASLGRSDFAAMLPAIWVDRPAWGGAIANPARITGFADVFEAQFRIQIIDGRGAILADVPAAASCGTGCLGTFDVMVRYAGSVPQWATLRVFDPSAKDGTPIDVVDYPVWLSY